jgi:formylglycine-generating enzyme required for sulfatase activity/tRNA A-37 threonylcarbamoyl transferase component Bud32
MIPVVCAYCGTRILVPATLQGKEGPCYGCGRLLTIPRQDLPAPTDLQFPPGHRVSNRYTLGPVLGKGGMGVVYQAQDDLIREEVALKFMHPSRLRSSRARQHFIHEAQIARRLRHEHVVAVHDVSATDEGILYLTMEVLRGQSLRSFLRARRREQRLLDVRLAVRLTTQVLEALEYAHRTVVHRDIKPENVMLLPGEQTKVLDFGVAKAFDSEPDGAPEPPQGGKLVGTMAYAAPEQRLHHEIDHRTDLYTVGLLFRELLTLRTPIEEPYDVEAVREDVSPSLLQVLGRALQHNKSDRWQSARDFRAAIVSAYNESYGATEPAGDEAAEHGVASTEGMVHFDGGSFLMGNNAIAQEAPELEVQVPPFYMDAYPVTNAAFRQYLEATGAMDPKFWRDPKFNGPDQPVVGVSWQEAQAYAQWAGKALPSEAQWEFAARGQENRKYPWGQHEPESTLCNFGGFLGMPSIISMHDEGATPEGVCDLAGNIHEWTSDPYLPYDPALRARAGQRTTPRKVVRGGAWDSPTEDLRCASRKGLFPESRLPNVGFRCVVQASGQGPRDAAAD